MKNRVILSLLVVLISILTIDRLIGKSPLSAPDQNGRESLKEVTKTPLKNRVQRTVLETATGSYTVLIRKLRESEDIILIPNFKEGLSSGEILSSNHCDFIINGGFYTKENSPLGLFFLKGEMLAGYIKSNFLNGNISKSKTGLIELKRGPIPNSSDLEFVLQSGPYFSLGEDKQQKFESGKARRSLIVQDSMGKIFFLGVYESSDIFSGPDLNQLEKILLETGRRANLELVNALNLDGGATLAFLQSGEDSIPEIKKSGSFFCIKDK